MLNSMTLQLLLCVDIVVTLALLLMSVVTIVVLLLTVSKVVVLGIVAADLVSMSDIGVNLGVSLTLMLLTVLQESLNVANVVLVEGRFVLLTISGESVSGGDNDIDVATKTVTLV